MVELETFNKKIILIGEVFLFIYRVSPCLICRALRISSENPLKVDFPCNIKHYGRSSLRWNLWIVINFCFSWLTSIFSFQPQSAESDWWPIFAAANKTGFFCSGKKHVMIFRSGPRYLKTNFSVLTFKYVSDFCSFCQRMICHNPSFSVTCRHCRFEKILW